MQTMALRLTRCIGSRTFLLVLTALVAIAMAPAPARAQSCAFSLNETKTCVSPKLTGSNNDCTITLTNTDTGGNSYSVFSSSDTINTSGGTATGCSQVTDPALKISAVSGNTLNCTVGSTPPGSAPFCTVGPSCGTGGTVATCLDGGTGPKAAGSVSFEDTGYTIQPTDTDIGTGGSVCGAAGNSLNDQGTIVVADNCNICTGSCSTAQVDENTTGSTTVQSCSVNILKQISCDGGLTWNGVGGGSPVEGACTGFNGDPIEVRYQYSNTGTVALNSCNIHDVTGQTQETSGGTEFTSDDTVGTIGVSGSATTSAITTGPAPTNSPLTCSSGGPNYDTANIDCVCGTTTTHVDAHSTANYSCESCSVSVDKQVTCQGNTYDVTCTAPNTPTGCDPNNCTTPTDPTCMQSTSCIGFDAYCSDGSAASCSISGTPPVQNCTCPAGTTLVPAQNIGVAYVVTNTGQATLSCSGMGFGLSDTDTLISSTSNPAEGSLNSSFASGASQTITATDPCNPALNTAETNGDTASLNCFCGGLTNNTTTKNVTATDSAIFSCQQPGLELSKTCAAPVSDASAVTVTATNTGGLPLTGCTVTDAYDTGVSCPQTPPGAHGPITLTSDASNPSSLNPASFDLAASGNAGSSGEFDGSISGLSANACNLAQITCNINGGSATISATAQATCPVGLGCETRTPGFWKNRPGLSQQVITAAGGSLESCGLMLNNTLAAPNDCSTTVDMCQLGTVAHNLGIDPVQSNLIFQCAAAALNFAVTAQDGGECANTLPGSDLTFDQCCGTGGTCATGDPATLNACQAAVSNFNQLFENCPDPTNPLCTASSTLLSNPGPASTTACKTTRGTGDFVNDQAGVGAGAPVPDCSDTTGRLYLQKKTGKH